MFVMGLPPKVGLIGDLISRLDAVRVVACEGVSFNISFVNRNLITIW